MSRMTYSFAFSLACVSFFPTAALAEPRRPTHVACVGDSITAGSGASSPARNYVSLLQGLFGNTVQVKNFGHSGATMLSAPYGNLPYSEQAEYQAATDFVSNAGAGAVVSVVILLGANDSKPSNWEPAGKPKNDQQYLTDYRALVDHFLGLSTKPVVYVGLPLATGNNPCCGIRGNVIFEQQIPLIRQVAMEKRLPIVDLNTGTMGHPEYFGDGVHPNDVGYAAMAGLVKKGLDREPSVRLASPAPGALLPLGLVPLAVETAPDTVDLASVEFVDGANSLGKVEAKPFTFNWSAPAGAHTISVKAIDTTLASASSEPVSFTVVAAAGGGTAGVGMSGASTTGAAGMPSAGMPTGGSPLSSGGSASAGASANASPAPSPAVQTTTNAGCGCGMPSARPDAAAYLLLGALSALGRRRRSRVFSRAT